MRIRLAAKGGRGAGEQLRLRIDLRMHLHADHDFPVAVGAADQVRVFRGGCHHHHRSDRIISRRLLDHLAEREQRLLVERPADQLQAERQTFGRQPGRHRDARQARHVHRHREHVVEIHLDRIGAALLADAEGGRRRRRRQDRVDALREHVLEILLDQRAHLLRAQVIGVVIAGREHVGADHHAAAHLGAETRRARRLIHADHIAALLAQAVAHAVIAREIGRGFRRRHDVIGRQRVFGVRQRNLDHLGAGILQPLGALLPQRLDFRRHAVDPVFLRNADPHALSPICRSRLRSPAPAGRRWWCPSDRGPPSSAAGSRCRAPCA